jgi:hypothetical protein
MKQIRCSARRWVAETMFHLLGALRDPARAQSWSGATWTAVISMARRELVLGHLAAEMEAAGLMAKMPERAQAQLQDALRFAAHSHVQARHDCLYFEAILRALGCPVVILKGSAYVLAGQPAAAGRLAGDLDMLVPRSWLGAVETQLADHGWRVSFKSDYDDQYYRTHAHELPPIVHESRANVLDLHHSILPLTSRLKPKPTEMIAAAQDVGSTGLKILSREDQLLHSATHLFYDGDLTGGLRNLHDVHRLVRVHVQDATFWHTLDARAALHGLQKPLFYALRYARKYLGTTVPDATLRQLKHGPVSTLIMDLLVHLRLTHATTGKHPPHVRAATFLLYLRSHWLRMPPLMLAQHLWTKYRMAKK